MCYFFDNVCPSHCPLSPLSSIFSCFVTLTFVDLFRDANSVEGDLPFPSLWLVPLFFLHCTTALIGVPSCGGAGTCGPWPKKSASPFFLPCLVFLAFAYSLSLIFMLGVTSADEPCAGVSAILSLLCADFPLLACISNRVFLLPPLCLVCTDCFVC